MVVIIQLYDPPLVLPQLYAELPSEKMQVVRLLHSGGSWLAGKSLVVLTGIDEAVSALRERLQDPFVHERQY